MDFVRSSRQPQQNRAHKGHNGHSDDTELRASKRAKYVSFFQEQNDGTYAVNEVEEVPGAIPRHIPTAGRDPDAGSGSGSGIQRPPSPKPQPRQDREDITEKRRMFIPQMKQGGYNFYSKGMHAHYQKEHEDELKKRTVYTRESAARDRLKTEDTVAGDEIVKRIRMRMKSMGLVQTQVLRAIHNAMLMANLANIYDKDFLRCLPRLLAEFTQEEFYQMWIVTTERQAGKTSAVQSGCAALILELVAYKFVVFAPTKRQAQVIMTGTVEFVRRTELGKDVRSRIVKGGLGEELIVTPTPGGEPSRQNSKNNIMRCLPATEKGTRKLVKVYCRVFYP